MAKSTLAKALEKSKKPHVVEAPAPAPAPVAVTSNGKKIQDSRVGRRAITGFYDPEVVYQIREIVAKERTTVQAFMAECVNMGFAKRGRPEIATLDRKGPVV